MTDTRLPPRSVRSGLSLLLLGTLASCFSVNGPSHWVQMPLQTAHIDGDAVVPAQARTESTRAPRFVVKVKDGEVEALSRLYFRDRAAATASFEAWAADKAVFASMDLVSCTYGGELVLQAEPSAQPASRSGETVLEALRTHPLVAYADPDYVARAEDEGRG